MHSTTQEALKTDLGLEKYSVPDSMAASGQPITGSHDKGTYFLTEYLRTGDVEKQTKGGQKTLQLFGSTIQPVLRRFD